MAAARIDQILLILIAHYASAGTFRQAAHPGVVRLALSQVPVAAALPVAFDLGVTIRLVAAALRIGVILAITLAVALGFHDARNLFPHISSAISRRTGAWPIS
jgi:hypothetical protein